MADLEDWRARFEAFVARKEREAAGAALSPLTTDIDDGRSLVSVGNEWSRALFGGPFYLSPLPSDDVAGGSLVFVFGVRVLKREDATVIQAVVPGRIEDTTENPQGVGR